MTTPVDHTVADGKLPGWLGVVQLAVSIVVVALALSLVILPSINGIVAPAVVPMVVGYAIVFGLPSALFAGLMWGARWRVALLTGAALGAFPAGLAALAGAGPLGFLFMSTIGAATGIAAFALARLQALPTILYRGRHRVFAGLFGTILVIVFAIAGTAVALRMIAGPKDLSCHNLGRHGGRSFSVAMIATLPTSEDQWPKVRATLAEVAAKQGWSLRDYTRDRSLGVVICQEPGTQISIQQWTWTDQPEPALKISVVAPQGGEAWRASTLRLLGSLDDSLPGHLKLEEHYPSVARAPPSAATKPGGQRRPVDSK